MDPKGELPISSLLTLVVVVVVVGCSLLQKSMMLMICMGQIIISEFCRQEQVLLQIDKMG